MALFDTRVSTRNRERPAQPEAGAPRVRPFYKLNESEDAFNLQVYLPGVSKDGLEILADNASVTILGHKAWKRPEGWTELACETLQCDYELALQHESAVDTEKIRAELKDGILRVTLPKAEQLKPRRIQIA